MTDDDTTDRLDRLESLVERQAESIETLHEDVAALREEGDDGSGRGVPVSRRTALRAGGLLALLGIGAGTASADPQGQVGTSTDPLTALYTQELNGGLTGDQAVSDLLGDGLAIDTGSLTVDGVRAWADADADDLLEPTGSATGVEVSTIRSPAGSGLTLETDDGRRTLELGVPSSDGSRIAGGNVVAGHPNNAVNNSAVGVVIGGGGANNGFENTVGGNYATVGGGQDNTTSGENATVGGGFNNTASGENATVGGGSSNTASGGFATVVGGDNNTASGDFSFAAGRDADTNGHAGAFVFGDSTFTPVLADADDEAFFQMPVNGNFSNTSSRSEKTDVEPVSPTNVLDGVLNLDVTTWEYTNTDESRHIGPMAEDFDEVFGFGRSDDRINTVDADGVALAAIQGLAAKLDERDECLAELETENEDKDARIAEVESENAWLRERLDAVEIHLGLEDATAADGSGGDSE